MSVVCFRSGWLRLGFLLNVLGHGNSLLVCLNQACGALLEDGVGRGVFLLVPQNCHSTGSACFVCFCSPVPKAIEPTLSAAGNRYMQPVGVGWLLVLPCSACVR
jgi:hypothetical protein